MVALTVDLPIFRCCVSVNFRLLRFGCAFDLVGFLFNFFLRFVATALVTPWFCLALVSLFGVCSRLVDHGVGYPLANTCRRLLRLLPERFGGFLYLFPRSFNFAVRVAAVRLVCVASTAFNRDVRGTMFKRWISGEHWVATLSCAAPSPPSSSATTGRSFCDQWLGVGSFFGNFFDLASHCFTSCRAVRASCSASHWFSAGLALLLLSSCV